MQTKGKNSKSPKNAFRAINYEVKHLSSILSDLSLITSNAWDLKNRIVYEKVILKSLVAKVVERCKAISYNKNISIVTRKIPDVVIFGDRVYLEKMLTNLVKNSIVYGNKNGHVEISAKKTKGFVSISVTDDGIGISGEDLPHVFERFYRADKAHSSDIKSIGLGLAIVKWVTEIHGGSVSVKNNGKGTTFTVLLPIK